MPNGESRKQLEAICRRQGLILALALIIVSGAFLRLIFLDTIPPGLDRDAAYDGSVALDWVYHGILPFWLSNNSAPDPLMNDLQALSLAVLGVSIFALRLPGAMAGILTLAVTYRLTADLLADRPECNFFDRLWATTGFFRQVPGDVRHTCQGDQLLEQPTV